MIIGADINTRSAARALRQQGYLVQLPANLDREPAKRLHLQAFVEDEEVYERGWAGEEEEMPPAADAAALHDLVVACLTGDISMARALAPRAFDHDSDVNAIDAALRDARRAA